MSSHILRLQIADVIDEKLSLSKSKCGIPELGAVGESTLGSVPFHKEYSMRCVAIDCIATGVACVWKVVDIALFVSCVTCDGHLSSLCWSVLAVESCLALSMNDAAVLMYGLQLTVTRSEGRLNSLYHIHSCHCVFLQSSGACGRSNP